MSEKLFESILKEADTISDLTDLEKGIIEDMVKADFECGMPQNDYTAVKECMEEDDCINNIEAVVEYYFECIEMGPAGFYEAHSDLDWSDDYVAQYGDM